MIAAPEQLSALAAVTAGLPASPARLVQPEHVRCIQSNMRRVLEVTRNAWQSEAGAEIGTSASVQEPPMRTSR